MFLFRSFGRAFLGALGETTAVAKNVVVFRGAMRKFAFTRTNSEVYYVD